MNTVWVGLDNVYGNILSQTFFKDYLQFSYKFSHTKKII